MTNPNFHKDNRVAVSRCDHYDVDDIYRLLDQHFRDLEIGEEVFSGKKVVIKPNLVSKKDPEGGATSHPVTVQALVRLLFDKGAASVLIAESPGGLYTKNSLADSYKASGFLEAAQAEGAEFNYDTGEEVLRNPEGVICRQFNVIRPIAEADIVVSLCKLKTHALTKMTAGVKNLFGVTPGVQKVEMHARFSKTQDFCTMLVDLCQCVCLNKTLLTICDGILAMEGDGPGTGDPRYLNALLTSWNPYALDLACCDIIHYGDTVPMVEIAKKRGLCPSCADELEILGTPLEALRVYDFKEPRSHKQSRQIKMLPNFVKPRPVINWKICVGCGVCARSCPQHTITIEDHKAHIHRKNCIRCFCCQEMCPHKAVDIKRSIVFEKILH